MTSIVEEDDDDIVLKNLLKISNFFFIIKSFIFISAEISVSRCIRMPIIKLINVAFCIAI